MAREHEPFSCSLTEFAHQSQSITVFLNCTKNIELTCGVFERTFTLAHTPKLTLENRAVADESCRLSVEQNGHYRSARAMKPAEWKTYRTRFLVKAKQLNSNLSFVDALGRQHSGRKGDYLVESSDGVISIAPRQIFEDIYVAMGPETGTEFIQTRVNGRKLPQSCGDRRGIGARMGVM